MAVFDYFFPVTLFLVVFLYLRRVEREKPEERRNVALLALITFVGVVIVSKLTLIASILRMILEQL